MKYLYLFLIIFLITGCSIKPRYDFDGRDKVLLTSAIALQVADGVSTMNALDNPYNYETNPLYGRNPSDGEIMAIKIVAIATTYWLAKELPPTPRKWILGGLSLLYGGVTFNNMKLN